MQIVRFMILVQQQKRCLTGFGLCMAACWLAMGCSLEDKRDRRDVTFKPKSGDTSLTSEHSHLAVYYYSEGGNFVGMRALCTSKSGEDCLLDSKTVLTGAEFDAAYKEAIALPSSEEQLKTAKVELLTAQAKHAQLENEKAKAENAPLRIEEIGVSYRRLQESLSEIAGQITLIDSLPASAELLHERQLYKNLHQQTLDQQQALQEEKTSLQSLIERSSERDQALSEADVLVKNANAVEAAIAAEIVAKNKQLVEVKAKLGKYSVNQPLTGAEALEDQNLAQTFSAKQ